MGHVPIESAIRDIMASVGNREELVDVKTFMRAMRLYSDSRATSTEGWVDG